MKKRNLFATTLLASALVAFGVGMVAAPTAEAALIEIRLDNPAPPVPPGTPNPLPTFSFSGGSVTASCIAAGGCTVSQDEEGLGVNSSSGNDAFVDWVGGQEVLRLLFDTTVKLVRIDFEVPTDLQPINSQATVTMDGALMSPLALNRILETLGTSRDCSAAADEVPSGSYRECAVTFGTGFTGTDLRLSAEFANGGVFKIESVWIEVDVPEPATLALFGAGLAGLGLFGRRRRSA